MAETNPDGALAGLRVIDLTDDAGRFATKLLTELGADVLRVNAHGSRGTAMNNATQNELGGVLDWWYDGGKRRHLLDLTTTQGQEEYRALAHRADLIVETETPGVLNDLGLDHSDLVAQQPALVQVSITPFGRNGPRAHWQGSDLVSAALGGFMSVTGLPDRPLNAWGRQAYNYAGFAANIAGLSAVRAARLDGVGRHIDLSIHETLTGSIENIFMQWFFDEELPDMPKLAARQGSLHWLRAYDLAACRTGYAMITPTPDPALLVAWMVEAGHESAREFEGLDVEAILDRIDDLMDCIRAFVSEFDAMDLWWESQNRHCAFGGVHDIAAVAEIAQFAHRDFFAAAETPGAPSVSMPARMVRLSATPVAAPSPPASGETDLDQLLAEWGQPRTGSKEHSHQAKLQRPLEGLRIADFTWVLAGPSSTRMLGDLGADVIRIQNEARSTLVNRATYPYFFVWNRSKRSATLNMKHPDALAAARRIIENSDVLIENYSAGVVNSWGLDWETVHEWNPRLVYVTMSGCGHDGPWKHVISYAPTVHAVCGVTHLTNFADQRDLGVGFSLNDHLAGFAAATTTLAALEARDRTGVGQKIDMAQLEIGTYSIGPALVDYFANGHDTEPDGNRDGLHDHVPNEVYGSTDGFVAVSVVTTKQWHALANTVGGNLSDPELADERARRGRRDEIDAALGAWIARRYSDEAMQQLQDAGVPAGKVQDASQLFEHDPQHKARGFWEDVQHDGFGARSVDTFPALIDGERLSVERLAPSYLGEHNFEVWTDVAGYEFDAVAEGMGTDLFA